jgi:hypothetical protein
MAEQAAERMVVPAEPAAGVEDEVVEVPEGEARVLGLGVELDDARRDQEVDHRLHGLEAERRDCRRSLSHRCPTAERAGERGRLGAVEHDPVTRARRLQQRPVLRATQVREAGQGRLCLRRDRGARS